MDEQIWQIQTIKKYLAVEKKCSTIDKSCHHYAQGKPEYTTMLYESTYV